MNIIKFYENHFNLKLKWLQRLCLKGLSLIHFRETKRLNEILFDIIINASNKTRKYWKSKTRTDFYFSRAEALEMGIITE